MREVRKERTGFRDERISARHRLWGYDCPAVDVDFILIEYDKAKAIAVVEYKHERAEPLDTRKASCIAISGFCTDAGRPFFCVTYKHDFSRWFVTGINKIAKETQRYTTEFDEYNYVNFLYKLRGKPMPDLKIFENEITRIKQDRISKIPQVAQEEYHLFSGINV